MASKRWEDGEEDSELFKEISRLFEMNRIRGVMDKELSDLLKIQWKSMIDEQATSDEEKAAMEKAVKKLEDMICQFWFWYVFKIYQTYEQLTIWNSQLWFARMIVIFQQKWSKARNLMEDTMEFTDRSITD